MPRYVILCDDDRIVLPIKAKWTPHVIDKQAHSFLWGEPNFFGGGEKPNEPVRNALAREVWEESATTYDMVDFVNTPVYRGAYRSGNRTIQCEFYYARWWYKVRNWPSEEDWIELRKLGNDFNEMCYVVTVPRQNFLDFLGGRPGTGWDFWNVIMNEARAQAPAWARDQFKDGPGPDFLSSETGKALTEFISGWLRHELPDERQVRLPMRGSGQRGAAAMPYPRRLFEGRRS